MEILDKLYKFDKTLLDKIEWLDSNKEKTKDPHEQYNYQEIGNLFKTLRVTYKEEVLNDTLSKFNSGQNILINHGFFYGVLKYSLEETSFLEKGSKEPYQKWTYQEIIKELILLLSAYKAIFY